MELTQEYLKEILKYNPETGEFIWIKVDKKCLIGIKAGTLNKGTGYNIIWINNKSYKAHRLIWLYMTGNWPVYTIDHINRIKNDNRFENLRDTDKNSWNRSGNKNNASGYTGVSWCEQRNKWVSKIGVNGKRIHLGYFTDIEQAAKAYEEAKEKYHIIEG